MPAPEVTGLLVLALCVFLFLTGFFPLAVTGMLGCMLMVLSGAAPFSTAFSGFGNSIVLLMGSAMVVGIAMARTGADRVVGDAVVRASHGNEKVFLAAGCAAGALLSMFLANTALIAMFIPVIDSICENGAMKRRNLLLPITCAIMIGGAGTLVGCTPQLTANSLLTQMAGTEFGMWTLTAPAAGIFGLYMLYQLLFGYRLGTRIWGGRPEQPMCGGAAPAPETGAGKRPVMFAILALMILGYVSAVLPVTETALCAALLCVMTGCCSVEDICRRMHWDVVVFLAACLGLAASLTEAGTGDLIGRYVGILLGDASSPFLIFSVVTALTLVLSQFITNSTAIIIAMPIGLSMCSVYGFSPLAFSVGITLAASVACCTPLAASQITMTQVAGYTFSDYVKYCLPPTLVMYLGILLFVPWCYPLQ